MVERKQLTKTEVIEITILLEKLANASLVDKKKLRRILRSKYNFHISSYDNSGQGFNKNKFKALIQSGILQITNDPISNRVEKTKSSNAADYNLGNPSRLAIVVKPNKAENHKLKVIAELIVTNLEKIYGIKPDYILEYKPKWLTDTPSKIVLEKFGHFLTDAYSKLTNHTLNLIDQLLKIDKTGQQSFDIWISEPFNFAVEFDESQHFNQFRLETLNSYPDNKVGFNLEFYKTLSNKQVKPSTSGFTKLKKATTLFPELLSGIRQDNRIRQRAFRDLLKDLIPISIGFNCTVRIPYHITNKNIKNFTEIDLQKIEVYLKGYHLLSNIDKQ
jgi:hypothetical protein